MESAWRVPFNQRRPIRTRFHAGHVLRRLKPRIDKSDGIHNRTATTRRAGGTPFSSECRTPGHPAPGLRGKRFRVEWTIRGSVASWPEDRNSSPERFGRECSVSVRVGIFGDPTDTPESSERHRFEVECRYALAYELRPGYSPSREELDAFREGNAIFHCWPYSRELVQNMTARMGLPIPPLPFLRLAPRISEKTASKRAAKSTVKVKEKVGD